MKRMVTGLFALLLAGNLAGSSSATAQTNSPPIKGMASTVGLYVYPKNGQSATKQLTDESQCYSNAKTQPQPPHRPRRMTRKVEISR
jgi:hypothetical protein